MEAQAPPPKKSRMKPSAPEPKAVIPPPVVAEAPKPPVEVSPPAVTEPAAEPAPTTVSDDSAAALPGDAESVILALERLSSNAQEAYSNEEQPNEELSARLEEFADAASGVRKAFRKTKGKSFGAIKDKLLRRSSPEADRKAVEVQAKDLVRRGARVDDLLGNTPMGPAAMGYWKEIRRDLKRLAAAFGSA